MHVCAYFADVWHGWGESARSNREAACSRPHPSDGHPGPLAPQQLRVTGRHQAASEGSAGGGGAHQLC